MFLVTACQDCHVGIWKVTYHYQPRTQPSPSHGPVMSWSMAQPAQPIHVMVHCTAVQVPLSQRWQHCPAPPAPLAHPCWARPAPSVYLTSSQATAWAASTAPTSSTPPASLSGCASGRAARCARRSWRQQHQHQHRHHPPHIPRSKGRMTSGKQRLHHKGLWGINPLDQV